MRALTRAGRRTNLAILVVLVSALMSGVVAFAIGDENVARAVVAAHGVAGLCLVVLTPWKAVIARRGFRRPAQHRPARSASVALAVLAVTVVETGMAHALGATGPYLGVTSMQVHVGAALAATVLAALHVWGRRQRPRPADVNRRSVLRAGAVVGGGLLVWSAVEATAAVASLPGADRRATGSHDRGTDEPGRMPVTQWLSDSVPDIDPAGYRLQVVAGRGADVRLTDMDGADSVRAILDCTGGWYATQDWRGVWLDRLLESTVGSPSRGRSVDVISVTGYRRRLPLADAPHLLIATHVAGQPLSAGHGAPLRLVAPGRRGFWWVKWVARIEVVDAPWWLQPPFPGR